MNIIALINISTHAWGILLICFGLLLILSIGSNRYDRRGIAGLQEYKGNFLFALFIMLTEWIILKLGWVIFLLGIFLSIHFPRI